MIKFISPIFNAIHIGKFNMVCATTSLFVQMNDYSILKKENIIFNLKLFHLFIPPLSPLPLD